MDKLSIVLHEHDGCPKVNAGFQNPQRPAWYLATQDAIVPKAPFFEGICRRIAQSASPRATLRVFEPGSGLGAFFEYILTETALPEQFELSLIGADVSHEMVLLCYDLLHRIRARSSWRPVRVQLHSSVNLLALDSAAVARATQSGPFDVVLASQFEHYFPNESASPLGLRLLADGPPTPTKHDFRRFVARHLRPGGRYFSVDDYLSGDRSRDEAETRMWDAYVLKTFSDPAFVATLTEPFPRIAASLQRRYNAAQGFDALLKKVACARQRRRHLCNEETAQFDSSLADLAKVFPTSPIEVMRHPSPSHAQFYLLSAER